MKRIIVSLIVLGASLIAYSEEEKASDEILKYSKRLRHVLNKNLTLEKKRAEIKKIVNDILDYDELARRSLGRHFKERSSEEIERFSKLMRELIETSYLKKITSTVDYKISIKSENRDEGELIVDTEISAKDGKVEVGFAMLEKNGRWVIYDLIIDEVSTLRNYRSEFNRIIREQGFDMVIKKMEDKLSELKDEK